MVPGTPCEETESRVTFTIDYRALNKVITNEGWQIPNMKDMLQRIG